MGWLTTAKKDPPAVVALNSMLKGKDLNQETRIAIDSLKQKVLADPEKYGADVNDLIPLLHDVRVREAAMRSLAREELIVTLKAQVEDGVEIKLQATRLFCSMARRGRRHRGDVDNSLVDFHTDR